MSQETLGKAILAALSADQSEGSFHVLLAGRIHQLRAPENGLLPWLSFSLTQDKPVIAFDSADDRQCQVTFDLWTHGHQGLLVAQILNDKLHTLLHLQPLTLEDYTQAQMTCVDRGSSQIDGQAIRTRSLWTLDACAS